MGKFHQFLTELFACHVMGVLSFLIFVYTCIYIYISIK